MKLAYNPSDRPALTGVSSDNKDIIFDLSGIAIYARGVKFDGKTPTVFKKHTSANTGGYDGLVPAPSYADSATRFLREDGTWVTPDVFNPSQYIYTTDDIKSLTNYTKATELQDLTTLDTLNVALGKLECKSDLGVTAYNWYKSVTDEDTDEHINKWNEIVDFLNGITDTTLNGILNNFVNDLEVTGSGNAVTDVSKSNNKITVTKGNSFLPLSGGTISGNLGITGYFNVLSHILFVRNNDYADWIVTDKNWQHEYSIIHSGNIGSQSVDNADKLDGYHAKASNTPFDGIPVVRSDGVMEIGKYIDFHNDNTSNNDYDCRLDIQGGNGNIVHLPSTSGILALLTSNVASATKLATSRKLWGQSFNGENDVNGHLSIGTIIGQVAANRAELSIVSETDIPCDLWLGNSGGNVWSINCRSSNENRSFSIYHGSLGHLFRIDGASGNVGIGTTSPQAKLDVEGTLFNRGLHYIYNGADRTYRLCMAWNSGTACVYSIKADGSSYNSLRLGTTADGNRQLYYDSSTGNWGVGTSTPQYKLDVNGSLRVNGYAMGLGGAIDFQFTDEINRYGGNLYLQHRGDGSQSGTGGSATGNIVMCKNGGNVLIGTSTDSGYKLDVNGTVRVSGSIETGGYLTFGNYGARFTSDVRSSWRTSIYGDTVNYSRLRTVRTDATIENFSEIYGSGLTWATGDTQGYLSVSYGSGKAWIGGGNGNALNWSTYLVTGNNIGSQSVNYANTSGSANYASSAGSATSATSANYSRNLLGRNTSGTDYGATDGNLVFAEWNTYNDSRWYLKAKGYETRVGYANNADMVDGHHASSLVKFYLSPMTASAPADSAKSWFTNTMPSSSGAIVYNVPGSEKTIIAGKSSGAFGHMLQLNYDDTYLRILRYYSGSWKTTDWEKISAGYADSAERASYLSGHSSSPDNSHPGHGARIFYSWNIGAVGNATSGYSNGITIGSHPNDTDYGFQIVQNLWDDRTYTRRYNGGWQNWKTLAWTSDIPTSLPANGGNADTTDGVHIEWAGSQAASSTTWLTGWTSDGAKLKAVKQADLSVNYANSAGNADTVDGYHIAVQSSAGTNASTIYFVI